MKKIIKIILIILVILTVIILGVYWWIHFSSSRKQAQHEKEFVERANRESVATGSVDLLKCDPGGVYGGIQHIIIDAEPAMVKAKPSALITYLNKDVKPHELTFYIQNYTKSITMKPGLSATFTVPSAEESQGQKQIYWVCDGNNNSDPASDHPTGIIVEY